LSIDKKRIEESYDLQAENYRGWREAAKQLLRDIKIPDNPTGLDIGSGDGQTTIGLYEHYNKQGTIYGVDLSQKMVDKANEAKKKLGYDSIQFIKGDAESLDFPNNMFDVVISTFTFQFFPDKLKALREMHRVLKPGGYLGLFFPANACSGFQHESLELFKMVAERNPKYSGVCSVLREYGGMHVSLEEFHDMLREVGFAGLDVFGKHRIYYLDPVKYLAENAYPVDLFYSVPIEFREGMRAEVLDEMVKRCDPRGFKLTFYFIQGLVQKPQQ
jgi:ubiquinone/menaquinone biosynthesis C-methylase UbiE